MADDKNKKKTKKNAVKPQKVKKNKNTSQETKRVPEVKKDSKNVNKKGKEKKSKHPKLMLALKIFIIIFLLACVIGAGIIAGIFFGLFGNDFEITKDELKIAESNSVIVDQNGNVIASLSGDEKRKIITLEDMAEYLPKAYVAIEDERFYKHSGVDFKRTAGAILQTITGNSSYGGSTITQQLVKNITKDKESQGLAGIMRKVKEWAKAYQVERMISKDQILELYLNILFVGSQNLHGVELGAEYYFNKSAKDLDLAECAFMAGINNSPNSYDPYSTEKDNSEKIKNRTLTVLAKMKELGYIESEEDYNTAVAKVEAGLTFQKADVNSGNVYSYHTDAVIDQVITQVMEEKNISRELAENYVYSSGLTIYSTVDTNIQTRMEEEYAKSTYVVKGREKKNGELLNEHSQSAMAVIDYKTGNVVGVVGGLGEKTARGFNRATQMVRQPGSSIKPIAVVAPALQEKVITAATTYYDVKTNFGGNYEPKNDGNKYDNGPITIRNFIAKSRNIPALKIMSDLTPKKSIEYLQKMGITSLKEDTDDTITLAIGGITDGISPLQMAAAYATIANDGEYITPTFYTKVVDSSGNVVLTPNQQKTRVYSEQNAYILKSIIQEPVTNSSGTATYCKISGMDVAAKTGTTDDSKDRWLCGFTPYYAAATWFGYDEPEEVRFSGSPTNPAGKIWSSIMKDIHKDLENAKFTKPSGIVEATVCKVSGCLASNSCGETYKEMVTSDNMPEKCEGHGTQKICTESNKIATQYCPNVKTNYYGGVIPTEQNKPWKTIGSVKTSSGSKISETCTIHTEPEEKPTNTTNTTNTTGNTNTQKPTNTTNTTNSTGNTTNTQKPQNNTNTQKPPQTNTSNQTPNQNVTGNKTQ